MTHLAVCNQVIYTFCLHFDGVIYIPDSSIINNVEHIACCYNLVSVITESPGPLSNESRFILSNTSHKYC